MAVSLDRAQIYLPPCLIPLSASVVDKEEESTVGFLPGPTRATFRLPYFESRKPRSEISDRTRHIDI